MKLLRKSKAAALIASTFIVSMAVPAQANIFGTQEVKRWDMCDWERIPENVLRRIERRGDYEDILRRMFEFCPEQALGFTDRPTATVSEANDDGGYNESDEQRGREPDGSSEPDDDDGDGDDAPADNGPSDNGPEDDGPEDEGPGDDDDDDDDQGGGTPGTGCCGLPG